MLQIKDLPNEVISQIFGYLDYISVVKSREICSDFCAIVDASVVLQYKIQLGLSSADDGSSRNAADVAQRKRALEMWRRAWEVAQITETDVIVPMKYSLTEGACWELRDGLLSQGIRGDKRIAFNRLGAVSRDIEAREWIADVGSTFRDFTTDTSQDLIVLIHDKVLKYPHATSFTRKLNFTFRTLSGAPHPLASGAEMAHETEGNEKVAIQVNGPFVCGAFYYDRDPVDIDDRSRILVWNWTTGVCTLDVCVPHLTHFAFLSPDLLIASVSSYRPSSNLNLLIYDYVNGTRDLVCKFQLPPLSEEIEIAYPDIKSDPSSPSWTPDLNPECPFVAKRDARLYGIVTDLFDIHGEQWNSWLFFQASALLKHIPSPASSIHTLEEGDICISWDMWSRETRFIHRPEYDHKSVWMDACISGLRFVSSDLYESDQNNGTDSWKTEVVIHDFNQVAIRKALKSGDTIGISTEMTRIHRPQHYATPIETPLPYRTSYIRTDESFSDAMCTEDHVLLVMPENEHCYRILTV